MARSRPTRTIAGKLPQPAAEVALELLGMEAAAGGWHVLVRQHLALLSPRITGRGVPLHTTSAIPVTGY